MFRTLRADEIECRCQQVKQKGAVLLLYKDARCDMKILDETFTALYWKREHTRNNANCIVSIWNDDIKQWVSKEDTGTESNTEKEKGQASDSFKRACFNWGIGRELYSSPFIWIKLNPDEVESSNGKYKLKFGLSFKVSKIEYDENRNISFLEIQDNKGKVRYTFKGNTAPTQLENNQPNTKTPESKKASEKQVTAIYTLLNGDKDREAKIKEHYKIESMKDLTSAQASAVIKKLEE